jgi:hypothetical protein
MLSPFPVVRVRGRLTPGGARVTLFTIRAPRRVAIEVRCSGRGCPARAWARSSQLTRVRSFEARLRAGTRLDITITRAGWIGKQTTLIVRRDRAPRRLDRCLMPGTSKPTECPS